MTKLTTDEIGGPDYESLRQVLVDALKQAAVGKGHERHARGNPFEKQHMQTISQLLATDRGMAFQAIKKLTEGLDMADAGARERELLGAINYIAGIVLYHRLGYALKGDAMLAVESQGPEVDAITQHYADSRRGDRRYTPARIAWELERTAMGDGHYGNALRVAKDLECVDAVERSLLDRWATGKQGGTEHIALQELALKIDNHYSATSAGGGE